MNAPNNTCSVKTLKYVPITLAGSRSIWILHLYASLFVTGALWVLCCSTFAVCLTFGLMLMKTPRFCIIWASFRGSESPSSFKSNIRQTGRQSWMRTDTVRHEQDGPEETCTLTESYKYVIVYYIMHAVYADNPLCC